MKYLKIRLIAFLLLIIPTSLAWATETVTLVGNKSDCHLPQLTFSGKNYFLRFVATQNGTTMNEYIGESDTLDNWSTLMTIKEHPTNANLKDILPSYLSFLKSYMIQPPKILARQDQPNDVTLILFLADAKKQKIEYVINRTFKPQGQPAKSYVYSEHFPLSQKQNLPALAKSQDDLIKALGSLNANIVDIKSAQSLQTCLSH